MWLHPSSSISRTIGPLPPHPSPHSATMNHPTAGRPTYSSSSQDVHYHHRPNPAHSQDMVGPNQRVAANNARRIEHLPGGYVACGTGMFASRTIRAEVHEVQKANVGRKCVSIVHAMSTTRLGPLSLFSNLNIIQLLCRYAASKDRRALDPPPVTELRIYDIRDAGNGTTQETEVDYR